MVTTTPKRITLDDVLVIDTDVHAHDAPEALAPYIDAEWRPVLEKLGKTPRRYLEVPGYCHYNVVGGPKTPGSSRPTPKGDSRIEIVWNAEQMVKELNNFNIDIGILFPDFLLRIGGLPNVRYVTALAQAYHRWLNEQWLSADNNLYGVIIAIPQDPEEAAREIDRWATNDRYCAVYLPTCETYPLWGHRKYDPIFEAAQRHDLAVMLHSVTGLTATMPFNWDGFLTPYGSHTVSHVFAMMCNIISMLETGVPVRYPKLRLCFCESGLTWVPFLRMKMDKEYNEYRFLLPHFNDRPSKWIRKFYFATQPVEEPENRQDLVDLIRIYDGEDTTIFASDWPHHDFDHPRAVFDLPVSETVKRKIMGANALKLLPRVKVPIKYQDAYRQGETL